MCVNCETCWSSSHQKLGPSHGHLARDIRSVFTIGYEEPLQHRCRRISLDDEAYEFGAKGARMWNAHVAIQEGGESRSYVLAKTRRLLLTQHLVTYEIRCICYMRVFNLTFNMLLSLPLKHKLSWVYHLTAVCLPETRRAKEIECQSRERITLRDVANMPAKYQTKESPSRSRF